MELYCKDCKLVYSTPRCPGCGNKRGETAREDDICFLTEREQMWAEMLEDVLRQNGIPYIFKNRYGRGITVTLGFGSERVSFFVKYRDLPRAREIVEELFEAPADENSFSEETHR